ncbi:MAG: D-alanyl-D-alanine carboxypeptidase family protein [Alphaproteobacteria bacterium]
MTFAAIVATGAPAPIAAAPGLVVDGASGEVLHQERALDPWRPASLAKLMTLYLLFEALDAGTLRPEDRLAVSARAAAQPPTRLGLAEGETIAVGEALAALAVRSANDAAMVLAEAMAGDEHSFAERMTFRARDLGMTGTRFANASGLPHPGNVTNARDMAVLARALLANFPDEALALAAPAMTVRGANLPTFNGLLTGYAGADGLKTGFTCASGYNLVGSATRDGRRLIGVVLGAESRDARLGRMRRLLDRGFAASGSGVLLGDLYPPAEGAAEPPVVIAPQDCGRQEEVEIVLTGRQAPAGRAGIGGWSVALGIYPDRATAQATIAAARAGLGGGGSPGRPLIVERRAAGITRFSALLTNMTQQQASGACRRLRAGKAYCVTVGPEALRNPRTMWW